MRLSFTCASGRTSYWVTTGPVFVFVTVAGIWNEDSLSSMIRDIAGVVQRRCDRSRLGRRQKLVGGQLPDAGALDLSVPLALSYCDPGCGSCSCDPGNGSRFDTRWTAPNRLAQGQHLLVAQAEGRQLAS